MDMSFGGGILCSVLGMLVVFFGLVCLQLVIHLISAAAKTGSKNAAPASEPAPAAAAVSAAPSAPGSAGNISLHTVSDRDAAMIMAIVADKMGKPLNELRFKSIKEVK